jgi:hypothetical protein
MENGGWAEFINYVEDRAPSYEEVDGADVWGSILADVPDYDGDGLYTPEEL